MDLQCVEYPSRFFFVGLTLSYARSAGTLPLPEDSQGHKDAYETQCLEKLSSKF